MNKKRGLILSNKKREIGFWKLMAITNLIVIILFGSFMVYHLIIKDKNQEEFIDDFDEEELIKQGFEKIEDGFYGMILGGESESRFSGVKNEIANKILEFDEFKPEEPLIIEILEGKHLETLKKETPSVYGDVQDGNYEIRFPSYFVIYNYEKNEIIKWFYFQTVDLTG